MEVVIPLAAAVVVRSVPAVEPVRSWAALRLRDGVARGDIREERVVAFEAPSASVYGGVWERIWS